MNLLYLTIIVPLISSLLLICLGKRMRSEQISLVGLTPIGLIALIIVFCLFDFYTNTYMDFELSYQRILWTWFNIGDLSLDVSLTLDGLTLVFLMLLTLLTIFIFPFAGKYLQTEEETYHFFAYGNLFIASLFLLILADNLLLLLLGWQSVSYCCYLMIGLKYKNVQTGKIAIKEFILMHLTDFVLLIAICLIFTDLNVFRIQDVLYYAKENLARDSDNIYWITMFLFIAIIGRISLFPFHTSFTNISNGSMPVMILLQTGVSFIAGGYLIIRFEPLFHMSTDLISLIGVMGSITIIISGLVALVQTDLKRAMSYLNLLQISTFFLVFMIKDYNLSIYYVICYTLTSVLFLISSGLVIHVCQGERNMYKMGGLYRTQKGLYIIFILIAVIYSALPFVSSFFYLLAPLIKRLQGLERIGIVMMILVSVALALINILRIIWLVFHAHCKTERTPTIKTHKANFVPLIILAFLCMGGFLLIPLPLTYAGHITIIKSLNLFMYPTIQLMFVGIALFSLFITYFFLVSKNPEIKEINHLPIVIKIKRLLQKEFYFEYLISHYILRPLSLLFRFFQKDPVNIFNHWVERKMKRLKLEHYFRERAIIRNWILSVVIGCSCILLILILY